MNERIELAEGPVIEQQGEALAGCQLALLMLGVDALPAASELCFAPSPCQGFALGRRGGYWWGGCVRWI